VKISKKNTCRVEIVVSEESKKQAEALEQLLNMVRQKEKRTWSSQFKTACMLSPSRNDDGEIEEVSAMEAILHFSSIGWKVLFACIPPPHLGKGWFAFGVSLAFIGGVTAIVGEIANLFGCSIGLKQAVTAITFVALGTSLPDTFASKQAATESEYADSAIGNVTGSNSVNVFLGLGLPWVIAAHYYKAKDQTYAVPAGSLAFSVMLFLITSISCIIVLIIRRFVVGGELGGSPKGRISSAIFMVSLWVIYVVLASLQAYEKINVLD